MTATITQWTGFFGNGTHYIKLKLEDAFIEVTASDHITVDMIREDFLRFAGKVAAVALELTEETEQKL